jgi:hypothetical protein
MDVRHGVAVVERGEEPAAVARAERDAHARARPIRRERRPAPPRHVGHLLADGAAGRRRGTCAAGDLERARIAEGRAARERQPSRTGILQFRGRFHALQTDPVHVRRIGEERRRARHERQELRRDRVAHVVTEEEELHTPALGAPLAAQLRGEDVVRPQIRIGGGERRPRRYELIELGRRREAAGLRRGRAHEPGR